MSQTKTFGPDYQFAKFTYAVDFDVNINRPLKILRKSMPCLLWPNQSCD